MKRMKNKHNGHKRKRASPTTPRNIDLRISPVGNMFGLNNLAQVRKSSISKPSAYKSKIRRIAHKPTKTEQMGWNQLKQKYPYMNPNSDIDFDGLVNSRDCKPLDPSKDGIFSRFVGRITGDKYGQSDAEYKAERVAKKKERTASKAFEKEQISQRKPIRLARQIEKKETQLAQQITEEGYAPLPSKIRREFRKEQFKEAVKRIKKVTRPPKIISGITTFAEKRLKERILTSRKEIVAAKVKREKGIVKAVERFAGVKTTSTKKGKTAKGQKQAGAGRPKQSYKYKDPRTGQPISAVQYHKLRKQLKSQAKTVETQTEIKQRFALAKRGLSPEEVAAAQEAMNARMAKLRAIKEAKQQGIVVTEEGGPEFEEQVIQQEAQQIPEEVIQQAQATPSAQIQPQPQPRNQRVQHVERMTAVPGSYGIPPGYRVQDDIMTGKRRLVPLPPREAWTR